MAGRRTTYDPAEDLASDAAIATPGKSRSPSVLLSGQGAVSSEMAIRREKGAAAVWRRETVHVSSLPAIA